MNTVFLIGIAVMAGVAVTLQAQFMGLLDRSLGTLTGVFITYAGGGFVIAMLMAALRGGNLKSWQSVPWYAFSAGVLGLVIVGSIGYVVPRLGVAKGFTLIVASQFLIAALIDHFGFLGAAVRPMDLTRSLGLCCMLLGVWLVVK
ncbi:MAG: DMT family transporter [Desulfobacterales bacterium]|nr:DMT family transporter [Desulfobacterales bacterium]